MVYVTAEVREFHHYCACVLYIVILHSVEYDLKAVNTQRNQFVRCRPIRQMIALMECVTIRSRDYVRVSRVKYQFFAIK